MEVVLQRLLRKLELNENVVSTIIGGMVMLIVVALFASYFSERLPSLKLPNLLAEKTSVEVPAPTVEAGQISSAATSRHVVVANETLWDIAEANYGDGFKWVEIAKANNITEPKKISVGLALDIPRLEDITPTAQVAKVTTANVQPETQIINEVQSQSTSYTIQAGDYLWKIAENVYKDGYQWTKIWEANKSTILNPNIIPVNLVINIP